MNEIGKMIQIYLHDGNPTGIKIASTTRRELNAVMIPRQLLGKAIKEIKELQNIGVYFLFGQNKEGENKAYIGEGENVSVRLKEHDKNKDFWEVAIAFVSSSYQNQFNKSEILFLENKSIEMANEVRRYRLENGNKGRVCTISTWRQEDLKNDLQIIRTLTAVLGYPVFDPHKYNENGEFFYCEGRGVKAKGEIVGGKFVIREGSEMVLTPVQSFINKHPKYVEAIEGLLRRGIIEQRGDRYVFLGDVECASPSAASTIILQRPCSGKRYWKTENGELLRNVM